VALLENLSVEKLNKVWNHLEFNNGSYRLIRLLKASGFKTALVSGGFSWFSSRIATLLDMDYAFSNTLEFKDGKLSGRVIEPIVDGEMKARAVDYLCHKENVNIKDVVCVGDGANDRWMVAKCGFGVAFHAKSILKGATPYHVDRTSILSLSYFLNLISDRTDISDFVEDKILKDSFVEDAKVKHFVSVEELVKWKPT